MRQFRRARHTLSGRASNQDTAAAKRAALIAATALVHGMTIAKRNVANFAATGVSLVNPWQS
jgi:predicted nucleic acid-binding protein